MSERMSYMENYYNKMNGGHLKNSMLMNGGSTGPAKPGYQSNLQEERSTKQYMRYQQRDQMSWNHKNVMQCREKK